MRYKFVRRESTSIEELGKVLRKDIGNIKRKATLEKNKIQTRIKKKLPSRKKLKKKVYSLGKKVNFRRLV